LNLIRTFDGHLSTIWCLNVDFSGKLLISSTTQEGIKIWNIENGQLINRFPFSSFCDKITSNQKYLIYGSANEIKTFNLKTHKHEISFPGHNDHIWHLLLTKDGHIISASWDWTIKIFDFHKWT